MRACSNADKKLPHRFASFKKKKNESPKACLSLYYYFEYNDSTYLWKIRYERNNIVSTMPSFNHRAEFLIRKRKGWKGLAGREGDSRVAHFEKRKYQSSVASDHRIIVAQLSGNADYPHGRCGFKSASHFDDGNRRGLRRGVDTGAYIPRCWLDPWSQI